MTSGGPLLASTRSSTAVEQRGGLPVVCREVGKTFDDGTVALAGVDLDVPAGRTAVLLGPSGCGKTTLLRSVAGLDRPTSGSIAIGGTPASAGRRARPDVAMVFQNYALYPSKTGFQNIEFPLKMAGVPKRERHRRVVEMAELLRIGQLLDRNVGAMSGGQRQRIGIGRALIRQPAVLLMDEPLSNLYAELRVSMRGEIKALQRRLGTTLIFVTHDQAEALALADLLVVMQNGRIEQAGDPATIFDRPRTTFVASFLGAMNLIDLTVVRHADVPPGADGATDGAGLWWAGPAAGAAVVGLRPEDVRGGPGGPDDVTVHGAVVLTELLGRDRVVHVDAAGTAVRARVPAGEAVGSTFSGHVRRRDLHLFGADGRRLPDPEDGT